MGRAGVGGDAWPGKSKFWAGQGRFGPRQAGQGCCGPGQAGFGPRQGGLGSGQLGFGGGWPGGGVTGERGSSYNRNAAGQEISAQYEPGQGEFWAGSLGFAETRVDSRGWSPLMVRNRAGLTQFGADSGVRKLKMPIFEGEDAYGWVYRVEHYFAINGLSEREKLLAAALCLEVKALAWFQWRKQ